MWAAAAARKPSIPLGRVQAVVVVHVARQAVAPKTCTVPEDVGSKVAPQAPKHLDFIAGSPTHLLGAFSKKRLQNQCSGKTKLGEEK